MVTPKKYILDIINEGIESAQELKDDTLKDKVIILFKRLLDFIEDDSNLAKISNLACVLSVGTMQAIDFIDYEELEEVVIAVHEDIERLN